MNGPDFICVGLPKAGTGWLFDQLNDHPDFWMPPVKELLYLEQEVSKMNFVRRSGEPRRNERGTDRRVHRKDLDARDHAFLRHAASCRGEPRDMARYAKLFSYRGELLSGDISPPYWALKEDVIRDIGAQFTKTKIIILVRDPVSRAWSRISMAYRGKLFNTALLEDREGFRRYVETTKKIGSLRATKVVPRWRRFAPENPFQWFLFDDIVERPEAARHDILKFLGADPNKKGTNVAPHYNRKSDQIRLEMNPMTQSVLAEQYTEELIAGADFFGGAATGWLSKYGIKR